MVCLGNICRSPMAEGILRHKAALHNKNFQIDSAGTGDWHQGEQPDLRAIEYMRSQGIDISKLRARQICEEDFHEFDLILTMDAENYTNVNRIKPANAKARVEMAMNLKYPGINISVPDPYFGGAEGFAQVFSMLDETLDTLIQTKE